MKRRSRMKSYPFARSETTRHGRTVFYFRRGQGPRFRLPDDPASPEFKEAYEQASKGVRPLDVRDMPVTPIERRKQRTEAALRRALKSAKTRARLKGVAFDLSLDDCFEMAEAQAFRCGLTGIEFFASHACQSRVDPYMPSIDRVVPALGYVPGNVRIVVFAVNAMILDWGDEFFIRIANSFRYWDRTKKLRQRPPLKSGAGRNRNMIDASTD